MERRGFLGLLAGAATVGALPFHELHTPPLFTTMPESPVTLTLVGPGDFSDPRFRDELARALKHCSRRRVVVRSEV